jgi:hypothetical protein
VSYKGHEFCRHNPSSLGKTACPGDSEWLNWGGSFDWVGPQESWNKTGWPPPFELDSGSWKVLSAGNDTITLCSQPCNLGVRLTKTVTIAHARINITRTLENVSSGKVCCGLWNVIQVPTAGEIFLPLNSEAFSKIKLFPWPDKNSIESLHKEKIIETIRQDPTIIIKIFENRGKFKIGLVSDTGRITYSFNGYTMHVVTEPNPCAQYPHGCSIEIYRDEDAGYTELEQLWEYKELAPGEVCSAVQDMLFEG